VATVLFAYHFHGLDRHQHLLVLPCIVHETRFSRLALGSASDLGEENRRSRLVENSTDSSSSKINEYFCGTPSTLPSSTLGNLVLHCLYTKSPLFVDCGPLPRSYQVPVLQYVLANSRANPLPHNRIPSKCPHRTIQILLRIVNRLRFCGLANIRFVLANPRLSS